MNVLKNYLTNKEGEMIMKKIWKILVATLAFVIGTGFIGSLNLVNAANVNDYKNQIQQIVEEWNGTKYAKKNISFSGASGCASFSKYAFKGQWGHTDGTAVKNNEVNISKITSGNELKNILENTAAPGDAIRVSKVINGKASQTSNTHIFDLIDIGVDGITVAESNYNRKDNSARIYTYSDYDTLISDTTSCKKGSKYTVQVQVIHAKENETYTNKDFSINKNEGPEGPKGSGGPEEPSYIAYVSGTNGDTLAINKQPKVGNMIAEIPEFAAVKVYPDKSTSKWLYVKYGDSEGYSYKTYLTEDEPTYKSGTVKGNTDGLWLNRTPSTKYGILVMPEFAKCKVYTKRTSGKWVYVNYEGCFGWSYSSYLDY